MTAYDKDTIQEFFIKAEHDLTVIAEAGLASDGVDHKQFALSEVMRYVNKDRYAQLKEMGVDFGTPP